MDATDWCGDAQKRLQDGAIEAELAGFTGVEWSATWHAMKCGALLAVDTFISSQRHYLVLVETQPRLSDRLVKLSADAQRLEHWLGGTAQKSLSIDLGLSPSTVSSGLRRDIAELGISCAPSKVPLIFAILVAAAQSRRVVRGARVGRFSHESSRLVVIGVPRPESLLFERLTPAEYATLRMLVEGKSYADIGRERGVSVRTVANQVASMFRRLSLSGKSGLQSLLVQLATDAAYISSSSSGELLEALL